MSKRGPFLERLTVGMLQANCYVIGDGRIGEVLVIDPGDDPQRILTTLSSYKLKAKAILATHAHFDHVMAVDSVRKATGALFHIHKEDLPILLSMQERARQFLGLQVPPPPSVDHFLQENDVFTVGELSLRVIHTPGHSPGSVSFFGEGMVFTGDTLFLGSVGRTDTPGGDWQSLVNSIREKLYRLSEETVAYPGHGPETRIGWEKKANPFVGAA